MKIFSFKKGVEVIAYWFYFILFAIAVGGVVIFIVKTANVSIAEASKIPEDIEDELILASRFFNSEKCFAYQDEVGRVHNRVIDESKFTQEIMDKCFQKNELSKVKYSFSLLLFKYLPPGEIGPPMPIGPIQTFNYPTGGYAKKELTENVLVFYKGWESNGKLKIKIKNVE